MGTSSDSQSKTEILNDHFHSVYPQEDIQDFPDIGLSFTHQLIKSQSTRRGYASSWEVSNFTRPQAQTRFYVLKAAAVELASFLTRLFQISLDQGVVPQDWRDAIIVPVYKTGGKATNCRLVSLTATTCKLLEHIVQSSVMSHFDRHNILCDNRHGFGGKKSLVKVS